MSNPRTWYSGWFEESFEPFRDEYLGVDHIEVRPTWGRNWTVGRVYVPHLTGFPTILECQEFVRNIEEGGRYGLIEWYRNDK